MGSFLEQVETKATLNEQSIHKMVQHTVQQKVFSSSQPFHQLQKLKLPVKTPEAVRVYDPAPQMGSNTVIQARMPDLQPKAPHKVVLFSGWLMRLKE